jgi:hypothetical protein
VVIYINGSYLQFVTFVAGLISVLINRFLGAIKYIKERLANIVIILKA